MQGHVRKHGERDSEIGALSEDEQVERLTESLQAYPASDRGDATERPVAADSTPSRE